MPKKKVQETQAEQSKRFRKAVRDLIDAGELSPTEADERLERLMSTVGQQAVQTSSDAADKRDAEPSE